MQSLSDDERRDVLQEVMHDELKAILEYVSVIPAMQQDIDSLKTDMREVKGDIRWMKQILATHDEKLDDLTVRVKRLELAKAA